MYLNLVLHVYTIYSPYLFGQSSDHMDVHVLLQYDDGIWKLTASITCISIASQLWDIMYMFFVPHVYFSKLTMYGF